MAEEQNNPGNPPEETAKSAPVPWIPLVLVLLFIPVVTLALVQFVVIPQLKNSVAKEDGGTAVHEAPKKESKGHGGGHGSAGGDDSASHGDGTSVTYRDIISNVAGTMGTRFLKISFQVASRDPQLEGMLKMRDAQVRDAIISTLSSRTIQELEVAGGRNALRVALISAVNGAVGVNLVEELYFLDFIIQ